MEPDSEAMYKPCVLKLVELIILFLTMARGNECEEKEQGALTGVLASNMPEGLREYPKITIKMRHV